MWFDNCSCGFHFDQFLRNRSDLFWVYWTRLYSCQTHGSWRFFAPPHNVSSKICCTGVATFGLRFHLLTRECTHCIGRQSGRRPCSSTLHRFRPQRSGLLNFSNLETLEKQFLESYSGNILQKRSTSVWVKLPAIGSSKMITRNRHKIQLTWNWNSNLVLSSFWKHNSRSHSTKSSFYTYRKASKVSSCVLVVRQAHWADVTFLGLYNFF